MTSRFFLYGRTRVTGMILSIIAMIRVYRRLQQEGMKARLILQVHDELIVEAPENEAHKAAALLSEEMEQAVKLSLPLTADAGIGKTWYEAKG